MESEKAQNLVAPAISLDLNLSTGVLTLSKDATQWTTTLSSIPAAEAGDNPLTLITVKNKDYFQGALWSFKNTSQAAQLIYAHLDRAEINEFYTTPLSCLIHLSE